MYVGHCCFLQSRVILHDPPLFPPTPTPNVSTRVECLPGCPLLVSCFLSRTRCNPPPPPCVQSVCCAPGTVMHKTTNKAFPDLGGKKADAGASSSAGKDAGNASSKASGQESTGGPGGGGGPGGDGERKLPGGQEMVSSPFARYFCARVVCC